MKVLFLEKLKEKLEPLGFKLHKGVEPKFVINTPFGNQYVQFFISLKKVGYFKVEFHFGVSFTKLAQIVNRHIVPHLVRERKANEKRGESALVYGIEDLKESFDIFDYQIQEPSEIQQLVNKVFLDISSYGIPFLQKFSSLKELDNFYNFSPNNPCFIRQQLASKSFRAILLAKYFNHPDLAEKIEYYREEYKNSKNPTIIDLKFIDCFEELLRDEVFGKEKIELE